MHRAEKEIAMSRVLRLTVVLSVVLVPALASAQIDFDKTGYYAALGDSVAAGEGAMPVTAGYTYKLYDHGVFGKKQQTDFANLSVRGGRSWDVRDHQVAQLLCAEPAQRPTVVTITVGANDFLRGDSNIVGIVSRVVEAVSLLLNNGTPFVGSLVVDPITGQPCRPLANVTILVSNYYSIPHPVPAIAAQLDAALQGFDQALSFLLPFVHVPAGSKVAIVDLYTPSLGRQGLVTIQRRLGFEGPFNFDIHPTNAGHTFIAQQFQDAWLRQQ
jgi:lysophospholipase L1-like esterase